MWEGLVSREISELKAAFDKGQRVTCRIMTTESSFVLPEKPGTPAICVGPGTGFAPFRSFLQEKQAKKDASTLGAITLFFGCRKQDSDYIYRDEIAAWEKTRIIDHYHLALSRETVTYHTRVV
jgi:sulfite reductase alpha subunit-like flavoprotein